MRLHSHLRSLGITHGIGVQVDGEVLPADAVVIALGPWTNTLASSLQMPHISGQLGHSIVLKPSSASSSDPIPADCLFLSWQSKSGDADIDTTESEHSDHLGMVKGYALHCGSVVMLCIWCSGVALSAVTTSASLLLCTFAVVALLTCTMTGWKCKVLVEQTYHGTAWQHYSNLRLVH